MDLLERARRVADVASEGADEAERLRRLPQPTVDALAGAGLFTLCLPRAYGGPGSSPVELVDAVAEVARGDGAAGWCAAIASTTSSLAAFLEPGVATTIYPDPAAATGGVFAPNGRGAVDGDRVTVTGRWQWGSGTQHAAWIAGGAMCDDGTQRVCFFPRADVEFHDTWHSVGLRGTGSLDFSVAGAVVPDRFSTRVGRDRTYVDEPIARFPNFTLLGLGIAATALGIARRALDETAAVAATKTPQFSTRTLANSGFAQTEFARAQAKWASARAYLRDEVGAAWDTAAAGDAVPVAARVGMRLAAAHAAASCVEVVNTAFTLAGGTAVYETSPLGRCVRDAHVVTQHIMVAPKLNETLGRFLLGAEFDGRMI
jgi:alkylation response protein AidB-like acyl-CoA dehydrogenase